MEVKDDEWDWTSKEKEAKKIILRRGTWDGGRPIEGSQCKIVIHDVRGDWDSNLQIGEEINFMIGSGDSIVDGYLERCLATMDKGELAHLQLGKATCNVALLDYTTPEIPEYDYSLDKSITVATEHKEKGVEHFKNGRVSEAYARFKRAIRILIFAGKEEEKILPLYLAVCNNIAICHLKLNRPELGIDVCTKVLDHDKNNVKALLRRSRCYSMVRDFEKAYADLVRVLEIEPNNPTAKEMMLPTKADLKDMNKRYKSMVKKMFPYD